MYILNIIFYNIFFFYKNIKKAYYVLFQNKKKYNISKFHFCYLFLNIDNIINYNQRNY